MTKEQNCKLDSTIYSLYTDYEADQTIPCTVILAFKVSTLDDIAENRTGESFAGGEYIKTSAKGDIKKGLLVNNWSEIWEMDLDRAFTADFEVFGEKAQNPDNAETDFLIAIN